jgi:hypothetical protein
MEPGLFLDLDQDQKCKLKSHDPSNHDTPQIILSSSCQATLKVVFGVCASVLFIPGFSTVQTRILNKKTFHLANTQAQGSFLFGYWIKKKNAELGNTDI